MTIRNNSNSKGYGATSQQTAAAAEPIVVGGKYSEAAPLVGVHDEDFAEPVYRDVVWALLFLAHFAVMIYLAIAYGSFGIQDSGKNTSDWKQELETDLDDDEAIHQVEAFAEQVEAYVEVYPLRIFGFLIVPCALVASVVSYLGTCFVIPSCPTAIVQFCLLGSIGWTIALTVLASISFGSWFVWLISAGVIAIVLYYVRIVWSLIPFAAVNLRVALKGISANWGIYIIAFIVSGIGFVWVFFWMYVSIGVLGHEQLAAVTGETPATDVEDDDDTYYAIQGDQPQQGFTIFLLLVSLYWTSTILLNTIQVTVAGVMGTWCFDKDDADSFCSPAVTSSLCRSMTYSFGSICFGSLVQALVTALRVIVENARQQRQNGQNNQDCGALLLCILDCILQCLEDVVEYFNQWAYVFVGIYGYSYLDSGRKVIELFRARGWTAIISTSLVGYVLAFSMFTIAIVTGLLAVAIDVMVSKSRMLSKDELSYIFGPLPGHGYYAFL